MVQKENLQAACLITNRFSAINNHFSSPKTYFFGPEATHFLEISGFGGVPNYG